MHGKKLCHWAMQKQAPWFLAVLHTEHFQLNDNTLWSGYPNPGNNPNGPKILPQVRKQIFEGNYDSATTLWKKMQGPYSARYLPLADLWLKNNLKDSSYIFLLS